MKALTFETIYRDGKIEIPGDIKFKNPMRVLVVFIDKYFPSKKNKQHFSFAKSLELTKDCKGTISDLIINERRDEKW